MSKEGLVTFEGKVVELLRGGMFKVLIDDNGHQLIAQLNGRMRMHRIKVLIGDTVELEVSPYDLSKGRITRRR